MPPRVPATEMVVRLQVVLPLKGVAGLEIIQTGVVIQQVMGGINPLNSIFLSNTRIFHADNWSSISGDIPL